MFARFFPEPRPIQAALVALAGGIASGHGTAIAESRQLSQIDRTLIKYSPGFLFCVAQYFAYHDGRNPREQATNALAAALGFTMGYYIGHNLLTAAPALRL